METWRGVWTALATPFRSDGEIDWKAFEQLLGMQVTAGVKGIVISGTTGESPTLAVQEKLSLVRKARAILPERVRVMAGCGDNNTKQSAELSKLAEDAGADSLLIVTPPYNKPSVNGLVGHYTAIAQAVKIPLCVYHVPGRTAQMLTPEALAAICAVKGVKAVKEASADLGFFARARKKVAAQNIHFLSGDDPTYLPSLAVGGIGVISVVSNVFPAAMVAMTRAFETRDTERARALHDALLPAIDIMHCETNPGPLKAALAGMRVAQNVVRQPLAVVTEANEKKVSEIMGQVTAALAPLLG